MNMNANELEFEVIECLEKPMLFTNARIDRKTVPEGLYCYDVRHDDECQGLACELAPFITVNHWGTVLSKEPVKLEDNRRFINPEEDWNYLGATVMIPEYLSEYKEMVEAAQNGGF